jgi:hypothetical protein
MPPTASAEQPHDLAEATARACPGRMTSGDLIDLRRRLLDDDGQLPAPLATAVASAMLAASVEAYRLTGRRPALN